jgi:hypothetical protein
MPPDQDPNQPPAPPAPADPPKNTVEVRVLVDFRDGDTVHPSNSVRTFTVARAKVLVKQGYVDDNPDAVKAAREMQSAAE